LNNGSGVTAKEAFNMLEGRAVYKKNLVNKNDEKYSAWLQLNFSQKDDNGNFKQQQYHQNWKYDLEKNLSKHPIKELADSNQKSDLIKSLEKGNLQQVTYQTEKGEAKWYVEANPKDRNINVYDETLRKQFQGIRQAKSEGKSASQSQTEGENKTKKESNKASLKSDDERNQKSRKRKGLAV
jgi:hypothetical protein